MTTELEKAIRGRQQGSLRKKPSSLCNQSAGSEALVRTRVGARRARVLSRSYYEAGKMECNKARALLSISPFPHCLGLMSMSLLEPCHSSVHPSSSSQNSEQHCFGASHTSFAPRSGSLPCPFPHYLSFHPGLGHLVFYSRSLETLHLPEASASSPFLLPLLCGWLCRTC